MNVTPGYLLILRGIMYPRFKILNILPLTAFVYYKALYCFEEMVFDFEVCTAEFFCYKIPGFYYITAYYVYIFCMILLCIFHLQNRHETGQEYTAVHQYFFFLFINLSFRRTF